MNTQDNHQILKTGTTGLAFRYRDGVIVAADKRVTAGYIVGKNIEKIHMLQKNVGMAISGSVSDAMSLVDLLRAELKLYNYDHGYLASVKSTATLLGLICHNGFRSLMFYWVQLIVAGVDQDGSQLYSIDPSGAVNKDNYMVIGSGSLFSLSKIEDGWKEGMTKEEAKALAKQALSLSISRDLYTGDGMDFYFITKEGLQKETITLKLKEV